MNVSYLLIRHVFPTATSPTTMTLAMLKLATGKHKLNSVKHHDQQTVCQVHSCNDSKVFLRRRSREIIVSGAFGGIITKNS